MAACAALLLLVHSHGVLAWEPHREYTSQLGHGTLTVSWKDSNHPPPSHLLVHFHGSPDVLKAAFEKSQLHAVLAIVNFPGLSSAYSQPFKDNPQLFQQIQSRAAHSISSESDPGVANWERITVSSFSAGYGSIRELLKTPSYFDQIDAMVTADSIYAGIRETAAERQVDPDHMRHFLQFAQEAVAGRKKFVISHSAQQTPYASTTETADYLLRILTMPRKTHRVLLRPTMRQVSRSQRGKFLVLGFAGESGNDHLEHLRQIAVFWDLLAAL